MPTEGFEQFEDARPSRLYTVYRYFLRDKLRPGHAADHSPPSSAVVMEK